MALGMILAGLSGAGKSAQQSLQQTQKFYDEEALLRERANLEVEKTKLIEKNKADIASQPFNKFKSIAENYANEEIPVIADPVNGLTGYNPQTEGDTYKGKPVVNGGFIGSQETIDNIEKRAQALPDSDPNKQGLINQIANQKQGDQTRAQEKLAGKTRKTTSQEAVNLALDELKVSDPETYVKVKEALGKAGEFDFKVAQEKGKEAAASNKLEQEQRNENRKYNLLLEQVRAKEGKGENATALIQNVEYLKSLNYSAEDIKNFIYNKKQMSVDDLAGKLMSSDTLGSMTPQDAVTKAMGIKNTIDNLQSAQVNPPEAAINYLKQHPETAAQFKAKYPGFDMSTIKDLDKKNRGSSGTIEYR